MGDDKQPIDQQFLDYFHDELGLDVSNDDLLEIKESLYYLGKAIHKYHLQQNGGDFNG